MKQILGGKIAVEAEEMAEIEAASENAPEVEATTQE